jgi:Spy/CpxP family protein refolding chaperone
MILTTALTQNSARPCPFPRLAIALLLCLSVMSFLTSSFISEASAAKPSVEQQTGTDKGSANLEALPAQMMKKLGLTSDQQKKINHIADQGRKKSKPLTQKLMVERQALWAYLKSPKADEKEALKRTSDVRKIRQQISELRLHTWFAIRKVLTPQQLEKLSHSNF